MSDGSQWRVVVTRRAEKELRALLPPEQLRVRAAIDALSAGPPRGDLKKLKGREDEWRLRVGDLRVRFGADFQAHVIVVLRVLRRGRAYRN